MLHIWYAHHMVHLWYTHGYTMASAVGPWEEDKWNMMYGHFNVTETLAEADSVFFNIERTRPGMNLVIDNRFWKTIGNTEITMYTPGYG